LLSLFDHQALEVAELDDKVAMAKMLGGGHKQVLRCVYDQFANHVIQKCIECMPPKHIMFIYRSFCGKAKDLSTNVYGCHVIQVPRLLIRFIIICRLSVSFCQPVQLV